MQTLKIGIIGVGQQGTSHGMHLSHAEGYELVATCDITEARRQKSLARFSVPCYENIDEFLKDPNVDWALVATPSSLHAEHTIKCLRAGKNVIVEKPMCMNGKEADEMIAVSKETGKALIVFQNRRWDEDFLAAKAAVESGKLGTLSHIKHESMGYSSGLTDFGVKEFRPTWRAEKAWGGGAIYDWGAHRLDQTLQLVKSEPKRVYANLQKRVWTDEVDTQYNVHIEFEDGTTANVEQSFYCREPHHGILIIGTEGAYQNGRLTTGPAKEMVHETVGAPEPRSDFWREFYKAVTTGGPMPVTLESSRKLMAVVDAIFESDATKKVVEL